MRSNSMVGVPLAGTLSGYQFVEPEVVDEE